MTIYSYALATPATSVEPIVLAFALPLDIFSDIERGDCCLGTAYSPYQVTQASCSGEDTLAVHTASEQHWK